jgi:hypothetical protein
VKSDRSVIKIRSGSDDAVKRVRDVMPEGVNVVDARPSRYCWVFDVLLLWFAGVGIWPMWDPAHNFDTLAGAADLTVHAVAWLALHSRWKLERR